MQSGKKIIMENIVEILKKHKHIIALRISVSIILFSFAFIFSLQNNNTFYLKDIEGDRNVLSDIVITAYLHDKWHGQKVMIEKGKLSHKFKYYENEGDMHTPPATYGYGAADDRYVYWYSYSYEIADDANTKIEHSENKVEIPVNDGTRIEATEKITTIFADKIDIYMNVNISWLPDSKEWKKGKGEPEKSRLKFNTGMSIAREQMDFKFERKVTYYPGGGYSESETVLKNRDLVQPYYGNFALATINGKQYFTVINQGPGLSGENGIFTAVEYVDIITVLLKDNKEYGKVKKLVNFDFEEEDTRILGLHAVVDKLVLVMLVNDILTFRAYDPNDGKLLAELKVQEFDMPNPPEWIDYTPYIYKNTLSLSFVGLNPSYYQNGILTRPDYLSIVSVKLEGVDANNTNDSSNADDAINGDDFNDDDDINDDYINDNVINDDANNDDANNNDTNTNTENITAIVSQTAKMINYAKTTKIELLHCINSFKLNDIKLNDMVVSKISAVVPVNNKLVVFATLRGGQSNKVTTNKVATTKKAGEITTENEFSYPSHFTIFVFGKTQDSRDSFVASDNNNIQDSSAKSQDSFEMVQQAMKNTYKLLYVGEIITDADDDLLSPGNSYHENRNIGLVTVKGAVNND